MIKAGICGAQGDVAAALIKILIFHPDVNIIWIYDDVLSTRLDTLYRGLTGDTSLSVVNELPATAWSDVDVVFVVTKPHRCVLDVAAMPDGLKLVDLTGEYNLDDEVTYGLSEINRKLMVRDSRWVAVPGAVAHVAELAVLPLAKNLMITSHVGVNVRAAAAVDNSSKKEIERLVRGVQASFNGEVSLTFTPAESMKTAIVVEVSLPCSTGIEMLGELYENYFDDHNFTYIIDTPPQPAHVLGTNKCLMHLEHAAGRLTITAAIDARLKGAAGTAVHDMNLLFGLHERVGLETF